MCWLVSSREQDIGRTAPAEWPGCSHVLHVRVGRSRSVALDPMRHIELRIGWLLLARASVLPTIRLQPFGLPLAFDRAPWYAVVIARHCLLNRPRDDSRPARRGVFR